MLVDYDYDRRVFEVITRQHSDVLDRMKHRREIELQVMVREIMEHANYLLDETDKCASNSEIERLMAIYILKWIYRQEDYKAYQLIPQYTLLVGGKRRIVDFRLQYERIDGSITWVAIECDGKNHKKTEVAALDRKKDIELLREYGTPTLRFTSIQIYQLPGKCIERLENVIRQQSGGYTH